MNIESSMTTLKGDFEANNEIDVSNNQQSPSEINRILNASIEERIQSKSLSLPMLPQVTSQVLALVNDVECDASSLARLIQTDQSLAGHVMRISNSAAYSPLTKMTSLQQGDCTTGNAKYGRNCYGGNPWSKIVCQC